ncbi:unnamed protein product, partial [Echinostoma caproni]|uniref:DUF4806 domain-containing protein n=1 Tax=Echinostoma caproni TaxID=27848 RepID=A0A183A4M7_9TREM
MKKLEIRQKQLDLEIATLHDEEHSLGGDDDYGDEVMERLEHVKDYVNLLPADRPLPNTTMSSNKTTHTARRLPELSLMGYASILNCPTTIKGVIRRIPEYMQLKLADEMTSSRLQGTKLLFRGLIAFLENCLSTATYCYGQG